VTGRPLSAPFSAHSSLKMLATLRVTAQLTFAVLSLVLFGVSCGALVSDDLQGNSAIAVLAFVSGLSTLMVPGMYVYPF